MIQYVALLRGINVGGNKRVPMATLTQLLAANGFSDIKTVLASGNVLFNSTHLLTPSGLSHHISSLIQSHFGFFVPTQIWAYSDIVQLVTHSPFRSLLPNPDTHWYVTFLDHPIDRLPSPPRTNIQFMPHSQNILASVVNRNSTETVDFMRFLDTHFGKHITTRNWNTVLKIAKHA